MNFEVKKGTTMNVDRWEIIHVSTYAGYKTLCFIWLFSHGLFVRHICIEMNNNSNVCAYCIFRHTDSMTHLYSPTVIRVVIGYHNVQIFFQHNQNSAII